MQSPQITPSLPSGQASHTVGRPPCRAVASCQNSRKPAKSTGRRLFPYSVFHAIFVPHTAWQLPIRRRRFPCLVAFPIRFCGFPCDSAASHTQAISPYGIAVFPYGHTPDAFPHTFWQIPTGRPSPHTFSADPPYNPANQTPTSSGKSHMPARWVAPAPPALTSSRPWSYLHGYAHTCTAMASGHAFDETSADGFGGSTLQPNLLKFTAPTRGAWAWRRFAMRRRRRRQKGPPHACVIGPKGQPASSGLIVRLEA